MATAVSEARQRLLDWYDAHARDLPWRRTRDPYAIWVSEVMLQQTRVETVVPYFQRFMARFPDVRALSEASEDAVLAEFSGLGYYRRARLLHRGAKEVDSQYGGQVPRGPRQRRALPGVGRYTAGAIGSIAFDLPEPIVDGNVARVLSRWRGIDTPLGERQTERSLWQHAEAFAAGERPGASNQALMELGATVCTPLTPRCETCPLAEDCVARGTERTSTLPITPKKKQPQPVSLVALRASDGAGAHWLVRGEGTLFGGLWGCPITEGCERAQAVTLRRTLGLAGSLSRHALGHVAHVLTHRRLSVQVFALSEATAPSRPGLRAVAPHELDSLGISRLTRKIFALG